MTQNSGGSDSRRRPWQHWAGLFILIIFALWAGLYEVLNPGSDTTSLLVGIAAFTIPFAIHYMDVSASINSAFLVLEGEEGKCARQRLRDEIEYHIVSSAMVVLGGGFLILFSARSGMLKAALGDASAQWIRLILYILGCFLFLGGVARYVLGKLCKCGWIIGAFIIPAAIYYFGGRFSVLGRMVVGFFFIAAFVCVACFESDTSSRGWPGLVIPLRAWPRTAKKILRDCGYFERGVKRHDGQ